jgi:hypothetical protein
MYLVASLCKEEKLLESSITNESISLGYNSSRDILKLTSFSKINLKLIVYQTQQFMDIVELLKRLKKQQRDIEERFRQNREELENVIGAIQVITGRTTHSDILGEERTREASAIFLARNTIPINLRTPGARKVELIKELKDRLKKAKQEIVGRNERITDLEQYPRTMLSSSARAALEGHLQDRDLLTIEREFYNDLLAVLEPRKTQEPSREEQRKRAECWAKGKKHKR